jgi:hypothetical protein
MIAEVFFCHKEAQTKPTKGTKVKKIFVLFVGFFVPFVNYFLAVRLL